MEEYEKILFLNSHSSSPGSKIRFRYRPKKNKTDKKRYGFLSHDEKFSRALNDKTIPDSCKLLREDFVSGDFEPNDFIIDLIADMEARMALFYADFKNEKSILNPPLIDKSTLSQAVDQFLVFMKWQQYP